MRLSRLLYTAPLRLRSLFQRARVEQDLDDELRDHIERRIEADVARGMAPDEARRAALRAFGGIDQRKEECRDVRGVNFVEQRIQDLRFAVRQLAAHPGFACTAIAVLTLGIAASVAIFGFVEAALIRPLPYEDPSRLVTAFGTRAEAAPSHSRGAVSYLDFVDWRARTRAFESIAAYDVRAGLILSTPSGPEHVRGLRVSSGLFRTLGVRLVLGREFRLDEEGPSAPAAVVLSYSTWQSRFSGRPDVLGQTVTLNSPWQADATPHVVIGVLPPDFHFTMAEHAEFWTTIRGPQPCWDVRTCQSVETVGRLARGVSTEIAAANLTSVIEQLRGEYPDGRGDPVVAKLVPVRDVMLGTVRPILLMLMSGAGLLLVIAGINVVSLLLSRAETRTREIAVRHAVGASTARLWMQFATEAVLLAAIAAVCALMLATWGIQSLTSLLSAEMISRMPYFQAVSLSPRLVAFAGAVALIAAALFALTPAVRLSMSPTATSLKESSRGSSGTHWRRFGAHLVVVELAVALLLLVSAGLLGKSLYRLLHVDIGFNAHDLATVSVTPLSAGPGVIDGVGDATRQPRGALARRVADRVAALPGVQAVGYADLLPLAAGLAPASTFRVAGRAEQDQLQESWPVRRVSAGYFNAIQATLRRGRYFTEDEVASTRLVLIINETAAQRYFAGENPIGHSIAFGGAGSPAREIVGVVGDIKDGPPETPTHPSAYVPFDQPEFGLVVRSAQPEAMLWPPLAAAIREVRSDVLVGQLTAMTERMDGLPSTSMRRSSAWLLGGFAVTAFLLSVVGLYGVVSFAVGQRTREIGVRMALGAQRRSVYRLVLGEAAWLVALGSALGVGAAIAAATLMRHLLFGVDSWDPATLATAISVLVVSALLASYIPAHRAASVDPIEVLRAE